MKTETFSNVDPRLLSAEIGYLKNLAKRFTANKDDIDDLVQDTIFKALQYAIQFKEGSNLRAWLSVILRNTYINNYRRELQSQKLSEELPSISALCNEPAAQNGVERKLILKNIQSEINKLPGEIRQMISLHLSGYKYREIANLTGNKLGTVKNWIHKGRNELKHSLREYQFIA